MAISLLIFESIMAIHNAYSVPPMGHYNSDVSQ